MKQRVVISQNLAEELKAALSEVDYDRVFVLTDETTRQLCWPLVSQFACLQHAIVVTIGAGDVNKNMASLAHVWEALQQDGATRHSCMVNLGGGMVTDLGGFAASTFKRGIDFINIPTTLLAMVDASVGGKTGVNFGGLKNEVGVFANSKVVFLSTQFLSTLDVDNIKSGYAEMLKHGLISNSEMWAELLNFNLANPNLAQLQRMLADSVAVKQRIVEEDPLEHGLRKALNVGHTMGHAFESFAMRSGRPILHGHAVAYGMVAELYLSATKVGFPTEKLRQTVRFIHENYGRFNFTCDDYPALLELMTHDKKNTAGIINFTLLGDVGDLKINQTATKAEIEAALDFYREGQ